jgi:hypothetical protein
MSTWTGEGDSGSSTFTPEAAARVARTMRALVGEANALSAEYIAKQARVSGRTLRAIFSELDGREWVLGYTEGGVYVAETQAETLTYTARLQHQADKMAARAQRRQQMAAQWGPVRVSGDGTQLPML